MAAVPGYAVAWSQQTREKVLWFGRQAATPEIRLRLASAAEALDAALRLNPLLLGEVFRTRGNIAWHLAVADFLAINFTVDVLRKVVLVHDCNVLSGYEA